MAWIKRFYTVHNKSCKDMITAVRHHHYRRFLEYYNKVILGPRLWNICVQNENNNTRQMLNALAEQ